MDAKTSEFIYPEFTLEQAKQMAQNGPGDNPNHIANLLKGMTLENYEDYIKVEWDSYQGTSAQGKKQDPRPTLMLWIKDRESGDIVREVLVTAGMKGKGFWGITGNLGGSVDALLPCEKQCHLNFKDAAARSNIVANSIEEARNSVVAQSLFPTNTNAISKGTKHPDPTIDALSALERVAHHIIAVKCKEQSSGKIKVKRIDDMTANYCAGKPELVSQLGDKSKKLVFTYDRNDKKETDEEEWHCQTTIYSKATKKARGKSLGGGIPPKDKDIFEENQTGENPVHPFVTPISAIAQEVVVEDEDKPVMDYAKTDKNGYVKYSSISLVNYKPQAKTFAKSELAKLSLYDVERRKLGSKVNGESILRITATQSASCCAFQIKISNLAVGLRWNAEFGFSYRVEGIMPTETDTADTVGVDLALKYASKKRKASVDELETIEEENEEDMQESDPGSPDSETSKKQAQATKKQKLSAENVFDSEEDDESE